MVICRRDRYSVCFARPVCLAGRSVCPGIAAVISIVTDQIGHLRHLVRIQYAEVRRSLCGLGDLQLAPAFAHHTVTQMRWNSMTQVVCTICFGFPLILSPYIYFVTFCIHTYLVRITVGLARTPTAEFASIILMLLQDTKDRAVAVYGF